MAFEHAGGRTSTWGPDSVKIAVSVANDLRYPVHISWVNYEGDATSNSSLSAGSSWSQDTCSTHPWRLSHGNTGEHLACVCFTEGGTIKVSKIVQSGEELLQESYMRIPNERKSGFDREGDLDMRFQNDTVFDVVFEWVNYEGKYVSYGPQAVGAIFSQSTNSEHPWRITKAGSAEELACIVVTPSASGKTVKVSAAIRLCKGSFPHRGNASRAKQLRIRRRKRCEGACQQEHLPECSINEPAALCWAPSDIVEGCGKVYERQHVEGFVFFVERGTMDCCEQLLSVIASDMAEVVRVLPVAAVELLRQKTAVWVNNTFKYGHEERPSRGMCCHWSAEWLVPNGNIAEKEGCVECYAAQDWIDWRSTQPAMLLHELCHAFHMHSPSSVDAVISEAYQRCMASGRYDRGEYMCDAIPATSEWCGTSGSKPYCAINKSEFFAESCEAFFSSSQFRNDFFPYVHAELKGFDPVAYNMVEKAFGVRGDDLPTRLEFPADWAGRFAKVDMSDLREAFDVFDQNRDNVLQPEEFIQALNACGMEGLTGDEVMAAIQFADANKDGVVSYNEFVGWITSVVGAYAKQ